MENQQSTPDMSENFKISGNSNQLTEEPESYHKSVSKWLRHKSSLNLSQNIQASDFDWQKFNQDRQTVVSWNIHQKIISSDFKIESDIKVSKTNLPQTQQHKTLISALDLSENWLKHRSALNLSADELDNCLESFRKRTKTKTCFKPLNRRMKQKPRISQRTIQNKISWNL